MANENNGFIPGRMEIEEHLQDILSDEFTSVVFESTMSERSALCFSCKWYKDGKCIDGKRKYRMTCSGKLHRLEIASITARDQGVYLLVSKNFFGEVFSYANLYVREKKELDREIHADVIYLPPMSKRFGAIKHLTCTKVITGATIKLEAIFNADMSDDCIWFKSNQIITQSERMIIKNDKSTTALSVLNAKETDSGIYHVLCKSEYGIAASFATVIVISTDINILHNNGKVPTINDHLPDELEVNEGEELRIICEALYDANTTITWSRNGRNIVENDNIVTENYNDRFICLKLKNTCIDDTGVCTISLQDKVTGKLETSSCFLTVTEKPTEEKFDVQVSKSLMSAVACLGARLSFTCTFAVVDPKFYFVVWYIGHFRIERTNHKFHVMQTGGQFYLVVNYVEPGMAGEVTCELRKCLPNRKSILINSTVATLNIVPSSMINGEINLTKTIVTPDNNLYFNGNSRRPFSAKYRNDLNEVNNGTVSSNDDMNKDERDSTMDITYCRLEDDHFYLSVSSDDDEIYDNNFIVRQRSFHAQLSPIPTNVVTIEWCNSQMVSTEKTWYNFQLAHEVNGFVQVGISSLPMIEIRDPPQEQIMKFRVTVTEPLSNSDESRVCISPGEREIRSFRRQYELKDMDYFEAKYKKTGQVIGCGAFGSVVLIHDQNGVFYAAKILKTRTQKKRDGAFKEYEMLTRLNHPKIVDLYETYTSRDSFIFVMDYLWGGELFDRIVEEDHIKEIDVITYVRQICEALFYLHERNIAHLDLKPENIICLSPNSRKVKIVDFGLARVLDDNRLTRAIYGTRDYIAPEVLNFDKITLACDMWSLGVVTYMLLSGVLPFTGETWPQRSANITRAYYNYSESAFEQISNSAKNFIDKLLVLPPNKRMKASEALDHSWIVEGPPRGGKAGLMKRARENLKSYIANNKARWQRAGNVLIAAHRLRSHFCNQQNAIAVIEEIPREN